MHYSLVCLDDAVLKGGGGEVCRKGLCGGCGVCVFVIRCSYLLVLLSTSASHSLLADRGVLIRSLIIFHIRTQSDNR